MRYVSINIETTGGDVDYCQVLSIDAIIDDLEVQKSFDMLPRFHAYLSYPRIMGSPRALARNSNILKKLSEVAFPMTLEDIRKRPAGPQKYIDIVIDGRSTIPAIVFRNFLKDNGYNMSSDVDDRGRICIIPAGKDFAFFGRRFLESLPGLSEQVSMGHCCLDPSILYVEPNDTEIPSLSQCIDRSGEYPRQIHNTLDDTLSVIKLLRKKWVCGVGFVTEEDILKHTFS